MMADGQPSTSSHRCDEGVLSPRKKHKNEPLSMAEKTMIMNAYKYVYTEKEKEYETKKNECVLKTAEILLMSRASVYRVLKEHKENDTIQVPSKPGPKHNFKDKLDEFTFSAIRRKVHQYFYRNETPTLDKILRDVNDDPDLPKVSRSTLYKILKHLKFKYITRKRRSALTDRDDIILWRHRYLSNIQQYRREGRFIYYQDETWINEGHTESKHWVDTSVLSSRQAFLDGLTTGLRRPTGKGRRLVVSHIGSEEGFVDEGLLIFEAKKGLDDYHKEMNAEIYENWLKGILPKLKENSILVIDNAPYHSRKLEALPTSNWRKSNNQEWLKSKNIAFEETMLKAELLKIARKEKKAHERYIVDNMAAERGITILRLPPYYCELNPIELIWAQVKGHVAKNNKTFKLKEVRNLFEDGLRQMTPQRWSNCMSHVIKIENEMYHLGSITEQMTERFLIEVGDDSESEKSSFIETSDSE